MLNIPIIRINGEDEYKFLDKLRQNNNDINANVESIVSEIIKNVRENGDSAISEYTKKFDKVNLQNFEILPEKIYEAYNRSNIKDQLTRAAKNITQFHEKQRQNGFMMTKEKGVILGQKVLPIEKVGVYVPGGTAAYPSSVLMNVLPAKVAGVENIIMVTPPNAQGVVNDDILAAAYISGIKKVYSIGGAQAIAGLAYGTNQLPKVDKIVGPGNIYVATAKKMLFGTVDIDMIAGPSEILIIADEHADAAYISADMISQAEHDILASSTLICFCEKQAQKVIEMLEKQLEKLPRKDIILQSLNKNAAIFLCDEINKAIEFSNFIAPEHLEIMMQNPFDYLDKIKNAGSIFLGYYTPEPLGDYFAGPNHVLPTSGTARFFSPLSVDAFVKKSSYIYYTKDALNDAKDDIIDIAHMENLDGHANAVKIRFE